MFAYCRNNPVNREDAQGTEDLCATSSEDDNNIFNDMGPVRGGGGGASGGNYTGGGYGGSSGGTGNGGGAGGNAGYGYSPPSGGGGVSSQVTVGDIVVEFGHGGRHVDYPDISGLENAIANDVVTKSPTTGQSISVGICYNGTWFTYRYFTISPTRINVGTYF